MILRTFGFSIESNISIPVTVVKIDFKDSQKFSFLSPIWRLQHRTVLGNIQLLDIEPIFEYSKQAIIMHVNDLMILKSMRIFLNVFR